MKTETKQELRDRIEELEVKLLAAQEFKKEYQRLAYKHRDSAKRATFAAYALLATLVVIVMMEFGV